MPVKLEIVERVDKLSGLVLIYGQPKIGKTTLASSLVEVTIDCENGLRHMSGRPRYLVKNIGELREAIVEAHKSGFRSISIDTIDMVSKWFEDEACKEMGIKELGEGSYGADWALARRKTLAFATKMSEMFDLVILVGHQRLATTDAESFSARHIDLPGKLSRMLAAQMDAIGFCEIEDGERVISFEPYKDVDAGSRIASLQGKIRFSDEVRENIEIFANLFKPGEEQTVDEDSVRTG